MSEHPEADLLETILLHITNDPGSFRIDRSIDERGVLLSVLVNNEYIGKVIGKGGETAQAIRALMRVLGSNNRAYYSVVINKLES